MMKNGILFILLIFVVALSNKVFSQGNSLQIGYNLIDPLVSQFGNHEVAKKYHLSQHIGLNSQLGITTKRAGAICSIGHTMVDYSIIGVHNRIGADWYPLQMFRTTKQNILIGFQYSTSFSHEEAVDTSKQSYLPIHVNSFGHCILFRLGGAFQITDHLGLEMAINKNLILKETNIYFQNAPPMYRDTLVILLSDLADLI